MAGKVVNVRLDENLHTTTKTKDEVKCRETAAILELFTSEDEMLLVERDATGGSALVTYIDSYEAANIPLVVLDLGLDVSIATVDSISSGMVLTVSVFTKICIPPRRRRTR